MKREDKKKELEKIIGSNNGDVIIDSIFNYFEEKQCINCKFSNLNDHNKYMCDFLDACVSLDAEFSCDKFVLRGKNDK